MYILPLAHKWCFWYCKLLSSLPINKYKKFLKQGVYFSIQAVLRCDSGYWPGGNENDGVHLEKKCLFVRQLLQVKSWHASHENGSYSPLARKILASASKKNSSKLEDLQYLDSSIQDSFLISFHSSPIWFLKKWAWKVHTFSLFFSSVTPLLSDPEPDF